MNRLSVLAFVALMSCDNPNYPPETLPDELTVCEQDADCAAYDLGCCDSCNGGVRVSMRADLTDAEVDVYREHCGRRYTCRQVGCDLPEPACVEGTCVLVAPVSEQPGSFVPRPPR